MLNLFLITLIVILLLKVNCKSSSSISSIYNKKKTKPTTDSVLTKHTNYDEEYAKRMLNLAAGAYANSADACIQKTFTNAHKFTLLKEINGTCDVYNNLCSFYVAVSEPTNEMIVVFRGTTTDEQLFAEGWESLQPEVDFYGVGMANKYFFGALNSLWANLLPALTEAKHKHYHLTFTGHSLGAALASLAALKFALKNIKSSDKIKLYTFGQPRVGCSRLAAKHDELLPQSYRVVHRSDIVPHLPACGKNLHNISLFNLDKSKPCDPNSFGLAYHHGTEIWYSNGMSQGSKYYECLGTPKDEDFNCSDSLFFKLSKLDVYISDHRHYFDHLVTAYGKLGCNSTKEMEENFSDEA